MEKKEIVWAFDREAILSADENTQSLLEAVQSACESHAKSEIKKFAEEIRPETYGCTGASLNVRFSNNIDATLKKRGIE